MTTLLTTMRQRLADAESDADRLRAAIQILEQSETTQARSATAQALRLADHLAVELARVRHFQVRQPFGVHGDELGQPSHERGARASPPITIEKRCSC